MAYGVRVGEVRDAEVGHGATSLHTVSERAKHASVSPLRVKGARFIFAGTYRNAMHNR